MRRISTLSPHHASTKDRPRPTTNFGPPLNSRAYQSPSEAVLSVRELPRIPAWKRAIDLTCCLIASVRELPRIPAWKRAIDLTCCLIALPFFCLITVLMAIGLKLTSPGPILFRQERVGFKGSRFICYKFRTMAVCADTKSHQEYYDNLVTSKAPMVKLDSKGDKRVIPGGWILRATGLDELPQIINIFQGEMSLVGPRPCLQYEYDRYEPWHRGRFHAVPGLKGLWQVSGKNRTTFDEMVRLDIRY